MSFGQWIVSELHFDFLKIVQEQASNDERRERVRNNSQRIKNGRESAQDGTLCVESIFCLSLTPRLIFKVPAL